MSFKVDLVKYLAEVVEPLEPFKRAVLAYLEKRLLQEAGFEHLRALREYKAQRSRSAVGPNHS